MRQVFSTELDHWIAARHYLGTVPAGAVLRLEFLDEDSVRIGAMMWGRPTAPKLDQQRLLQLSRMFFVDDTESYVESGALGMARKHIRRHLPQIKGLITYASSTFEHKGTIYLADGWFPIGESKASGQGWASRAGRLNQDMGAKLRFARSP